MVARVRLVLSVKSRKKHMLLLVRRGSLLIQNCRIGGIDFGGKRWNGGVETDKERFVGSLPLFAELHDRLYRRSQLGPRAFSSSSSIISEEEASCCLVGCVCYLGSEWLEKKVDSSDNCSNNLAIHFSSVTTATRIFQDKSRDPEAWRIDWLIGSVFRWPLLF